MNARARRKKTKKGGWVRRKRWEFFGVLGQQKSKCWKPALFFFSEQERCGLSLSLLARALSLSLRSWSVAEESEK